MYLEIESDDRAEVERQVLENLWGEKAIRLTADRDGNRYMVTMSTAGDEPDIPSTAVATPPA